MRWIFVVAIAVGAVPSTFGGPARPPDAVKYVGDEYVLTSATLPPKECAPVVRRAAPAPASDPKQHAKSDAQSGGADTGGAGAPNVVTPAPADTYRITITKACLSALNLPALSLDRDGTIREDGKRLQARPQHVFTLQQKEVDLGTSDEQGPFLVVKADGAVRRLETKESEAPPGSNQVAPCSASDYAGWGTADVKIDLAPGGSVRLSPPRNVVKPNVGLVVLVCHDPRNALTVSWGGSRGLTRAGITSNGTNQSAALKHGPGEGGAAGPRKPRVQRFTFSPRSAGKADLSIWEKTDTSGTPDFSVELEVEPLYWGAVRFGLGTLFGRWDTYSIATPSGSHTQEVRGVSQAAAFELVSGFAPYFFDLHWGGRSQSGGHTSYVAPFIGFGVIGSNPTGGVQALTSVHLGLDFEVANNLSIALTFAVRRTKELASDYSVGSPVASGLTIDNITVDKWRPGFGVVLNATPDFLQFATGGSTTSSGGKP